MVHIVGTSQQSFLFGSEQDKQGRTFRGVLPKVLGHGEHGRNPDIVIAGPVKDRIAFSVWLSDAYMVIMSRVDHIFVLKLRIGTFYNTDHVLGFLSGMRLPV